MPSRDSAVRIPSNLRVVMSVQIDEAGRDDQAVGVDGLFREAGGAAADLRDLAVLDPDVGAVTRHAGSVNNGSTFDVKIEIGHRKIPPSKTRFGELSRYCFRLTASRAVWANE